MVPEYFNNILVAYNHVMGTCAGENQTLYGTYGLNMNDL